MSKIARVEFKAKNRSIPQGFILPDLGRTTVITGPNNSGKTNFINGVNEFNKYAQIFDANGAELTDIQPIYIPAEVIITDEQLFKIGKTSDLIKTLKGYVTGDPKYTLQNDTDENSKSEVTDLFDAVNSKLKGLLENDNDPDVVEVGIKQELSLKELLDQAFEVKPGNNSAGVEHKKFSDLGQGWQRLIIVSFILANAEKKAENDKLKLILIEEPEIYLHPKLKRALNAMLQALAQKDDYQVIMTTHDPYFAMSNRSDDNCLYSFSINAAGDTDPGLEGIISGIEDELLHIFLFNKVLEKATSEGVDVDNMMQGGALNSWLLSKNPTAKNYIVDHGNEQQEIQNPVSLALSLCLRHMINHPGNKHTMQGRNPYTPQELENSIAIMNGILV